MRHPASTLNHQKLQSLVMQLYQVASELEAMFPGRHFTPDGHLVGSLGECLVANAYDLELLTASNKGFDAISKSGKKVEIKASQSTQVGFRSEPEHIIVIKILPSGTFKEVYNGPGAIVWQQFQNKKQPSNGQFQISINKLLKLNQQVNPNDKLLKIR